MRTRLTLLASVVLLLLGTLGIARPAAASPAQPFDITDSIDLGGGFTYAYHAKGVTQGNLSRSGNLKVTVNFTLDATFHLQGSALITQTEKYHYNVLFKQGETQVNHLTRRGSFTFVDVITGSGQTLTCTYDSDLMYANGAVRQAVSNMQCG